MNPARRVRLCLKDLYHQDVVEMIERETKRYVMWNIQDPNDPDLEPAWQMLWDVFGPVGEMEKKETIIEWLGEDSFQAMPNGTFMKYFMIVAKDRDGNVRGARDGTILINPAYAPDLCVIYLAHIYMLPQARGTVLSYWLRIAPVEVAMQFMADLHARGKLSLPQPDRPGRYFGMQVDLVAEMEYFTPEERISWQRILFYGRGGFDAIDPKHYPFQQPDFREPEEIAASGQHPLPFMLLVRRMGRERNATLPISEAMAITHLMMDDHATYCSKESMDVTYTYLMRRLEERAQKKDYVALLPLPTGPQNLNRLKRLFRHTVYTRFYAGAPATEAYLRSGIREKLAVNPRYIDDAIARIHEELSTRIEDVYASREKGFTWDERPKSAGELAAEAPEPLGADFPDENTLSRPPDHWPF